MKGLRKIDLSDPEQGKIKLLVPIPRDGDIWGVLAPLRGTAWGHLIRMISGEAISHALHGWATPLVRELGPHPHHLVRRLPDHVCQCSMYQDKSCPVRGKGCRPGPFLLECYGPPALDNTSASLVSTIALAWRDGRFVIVIKGDEFNLS